MKERKLSSDVSTAAISVVLSVLLIILTVFGAFVFTFRNIASPKGFAKVASKTSSIQLFKDIPSLDKALSDYGFEGESAEKFLKSDAAEAIFGLYIKDMSANLSDKKNYTPVFNKENVSLEMIKSLDELVKILTYDVSDENEIIAAESRLVKRIREDTDNFVKNIPTVKTVCKSINNSGYGSLLVDLNNPLISKILMVVILILCIGIYILRYYEFGGFIWLGTDFVISFVMILTLTIISGFGFSEYVISFFISEQDIISAASKVALLWMIISCVITALLFTVSFIAFGVCRKHFKNK